MLKIAKKEEMAKYEDESSDDDIELKNVKSSLNEVEATINLDHINKIKIPTNDKPKRKLNLTDEERERRRQSMIKTREIRMSKVAERKQLEQEYLKHKEEETQQKVIQKADKLRKQIEKEMYKKMLEEEQQKKEKPKPKKKEKIIVMEQPPPDSDSDDGDTTSESEEEIVIIQRQPKKKKEKKETPQIQQPIQQQQPIIQQPRYPMFKIAY